MRVILDANVFIAAVASRGLCDAIVERCLEQHHIILCEGLLDEIGEKLRDKIKVPSSLTSNYLALLREHSLVMEPAPLEPDLCRDPDDVKVLGLVPPSGADCIVTGDKDLLVLKQFQKVPILTPRQFWERETNS